MSDNRNIFTNIVDKTISVLNFFTCTLLVLVTLIIFTAIISRQFGFSFTSAYELTMFFFPWIVYPGAVILTRNDNHITIKFIRDKFPVKVRKWVIIFTKLIIIFFSSLLAKSALDLSLGVKNHMMPILGISKFWLYISVTVSFLLIILVLIFQIIQLTLNKDYLPEGGEQ